MRSTQKYASGNANYAGTIIRRIGALLLANMLEDFPGVARKAARVVVYQAGSKLDTKLDLIGSKGIWLAFRDSSNM
jgi:ATP-dependent DNA helicase RecG